ncbi:MAG: hypothetical protein M0Z59_03090 [Nitrospiraceae bacterium]|nr:hypothetical protein [Nitrospiraceae bacterium]
MSGAITAKNKNLDMRLIRDLLRQKRRYEAYFKGRESAGQQIDNSALSAYTGVIKTAAELYRKVKTEERGASQEELAAIAREILENDYGVRR